MWPGSPNTLLGRGNIERRLNTVEELLYVTSIMTLGEVEEARLLSRELNIVGEVDLWWDLFSTLSATRATGYSRRPEVGDRPDGALRMVAWQVLHKEIKESLFEDAGGDTMQLFQREGDRMDKIVPPDESAMYAELEEKGDQQTMGFWKALHYLH